ncbi:hypothetical protein N1851_007759 [Merluccius polli]|uniref:Reverse transcriptase domain-containing protein n=1 Tax=Merluccius polli TaxID=89951 RepID=A0AA47N2I5_MERPO|nr:hypothetical protein N1851_007759 [Merluccius polli]
MLEDSSVSIQDYAEYVTRYISTCVHNIVPTIQVRKFPNQKPWINSQREYKAVKCGLKKAITAAKRQYREKLDGFYSTADSGRMWQGLQHITDYRTTTNTISSTDSLPDDLNIFYTRFETSSHSTEEAHTPGPPNQARACANELADVLTSIFKLSLSHSTVPSCFKTTTIVPLPKKSHPACLNDYRPVALTPIIMKCFERVVLAHIKSRILDTLDPLQYAYQPNRSTSDAIAAVLYSLSHLENKDSYIRTLFVDYSSAFNTVIPHRLTHKMFTANTCREW